MVKNLSHTLAYSLIALQEMNLAYKYPIIYWNCACLISDSGSTESEDDKSTDYVKIARSIGKMNKIVKIGLPDINKADYGFTPNEKDNTIIYGLKGILNVGEDVIKKTIENRPYRSIKEYYYKVKPNKQAMVSLIKGGAFDKLMDRKEAMVWFIWETCDKKQRLTLQNLPGLIKYDMLPYRDENDKMAYKIYEFNRYLKDKCKYGENIYSLNEVALKFLFSIGEEGLLKNVEDKYIIKATDWNKVYQDWMNIFREWITENKEEILNKLNNKIFYDDWYKYALGNYSSWEMNALCFYYHEHELKNINKGLYGFVDFEKLPEEPEIDKIWHKGNKEIKLFKLNRICGTCIAKDKNKSSISLLTTDGNVVNVKFRKEYFSIFDKRISERGADGIKHTVEKSWFDRGSMIIVTGMRSGENFIVKKYSSTGGHQLYKIDEIFDDGTLKLRHERYKGEAEDE